MPKEYVRISAIERFWGKVSKVEDDECWEWSGAKSNGYGYFWSNGRVIPAHCFAYELGKGHIPEGKEVDHLCRNHGCVNPRHLEAVTHRINLHRGNGFAGQHIRTTHCPRGHPYDLFNTYFRKNGLRDCRICKTIRKRAWLQRVHWKKEFLEKLIPDIEG